MKRTVALCLLAAFAGSGCAGLIVRDGDSPPQRQVKTWTGVLLTVATLSVFPKLQAEVEATERLRIRDQVAQDAAARYRLRWLHRILAARTSGELSAAFGAPPRGCRPRVGRTEFCVWTSAALLVRALDAPAPPTGRIVAPPARITTDQVVIAACEIPIDGRERAPHSCDVSFW